MENKDKNKDAVDRLNIIEKIYNIQDIIITSIILMIITTVFLLLMLNILLNEVKRNIYTHDVIATVINITYKLIDLGIFLMVIGVGLVIGLGIYATLLKLRENRYSKDRKRVK